MLISAARSRQQADVIGQGGDDILFYSPGDKNWWLGRFGGDALVEIKLPAKARANPEDLRVDVDGRDVTSAFAVRDDGRFYGLITSLADGPNHVTAHVRDERSGHERAPLLVAAP